MGVPPLESHRFCGYNDATFINFGGMDDLLIFLGPLNAKNEKEQ